MNHKKHLTNWFTTEHFRAINLALVTDVVLHKENYQVTGATVYQAVSDGSGQASIIISAYDATRLFKLLC